MKITVLFYFCGWLCLAAPVFGLAENTGWHAAKAPLMTRWAAEVGPLNALPEYPRPQLVRTNWLNLNGLWDYAVTADAETNSPAFAGKILVPFPIESALSGVMTNFSEHSKLWYRRTVSVPAAWRNQRVRLHFGAVDWRCQLRVNGQVIGQHQGGYDAFTFDVTDALLWKGAEEIQLCVTDPTEGDQPRGKQSRKPEGIFYLASSGIWQTVWLEPVPPVCIDRLQTTPDVDARVLRLRVAASQLSETLRIKAVVSVAGKTIAEITGAANVSLNLNLPTPHLWSPDDPFLYDLKVTLLDGDVVLDTVGSYFGMRKIELRQDESGAMRMALNDEFLFQYGVLDQGYWPDGIYTAPTDAALWSDLAFVKTNGFNLIRKHVKVEPDRWYYWCDKLGLLVWQDMPSGNNTTVASRHIFENELQRLVNGLENHPSIIVWVLFNEGWGQYNTETLTQWLKERDPTRLVDDASGWTDMRVGDLTDRHNYPDPDAPAAEPHRASVLGEFGGFGLMMTGHLWSAQSWGYVMLADEKELTEKYIGASKHVWRLRNHGSLSAAIYTQMTDVETECNGLQTYDRAASKISPEVLQSINHLNALKPPQKIISTNALYGSAEWKYTTETPENHWLEADFNPMAWKTGIGGFASTGTPGVFLNTVWDTADIWLRREFTLNQEDAAKLKLQLFHDEDVEVYLNGILAYQHAGFITDYEDVEILPAALTALHSGNNTLAVHCHQTGGGQGIDVGIIIP